MSEAVYMMFSPQSWNSQHSRTRAIAIELSRLGYPAVFVNPPNSVAGIVRESVAAVVNPLRRENIRFPHDYEMLEVWTPPTLPTFYRGSLTPGFDRWMFKAWLEKRMNKIKKPICAIIGMPSWWDGYMSDFVHDFAATLFDYHDPIATYTRNAKIHQHTSEIFTKLVSEVNGIITHTKTNYENILLHRKSSEVCLIRNAGNGISPQPRSTPIKTGLSGHPVIGTVGRISQNIDIALLLKLADSFPNGIVVNIGTVSLHAHMLRAKKNIRLMPPMIKDELRSTIQNFDVGILPYQESIEGSPLRVYDLLSESLQVVSTKFADSEYFKDVVHIADDHNEFITKTLDLLSGKKNWIPEETIEKFVSANTWRKAAEKLALFCESLFRRSSVQR